LTWLKKPHKTYQTLSYPSSASLVHDSSSELHSQILKL
jgi:hypothetical protein